MVHNYKRVVKCLDVAKIFTPEMLPNILDLAIVSGNLGPISSCMVGEDCGSYHLPLHVSIHIGINKLPIKLIRPLKNIDWDEFKDSLAEKEFNFTEESLNYNCENIDRAICNLNDNIGSTSQPEKINCNNYSNCNKTIILLE